MLVPMLCLGTPAIFGDAHRGSRGAYEKPDHLVGLLAARTSGLQAVYSRPEVSGLQRCLANA